MARLRDQLADALPRVGSGAEHILALVGLATVLIAGGRFLHRALSLGDASVFARVVCERYPFRDTPGVPADPRLDIRLLGVQIFTDAAEADLRARFRGVAHTFRWGFDTDALSSGERQDYLSSLPLGPAPADLVTPPMPVLAANSRTQLFTLALVEHDSTCAREDLVEIFGGNAKVLHTDPTFFSVRGMNYLLGPRATALISAGATLVAAALVFVLFIRPSKRSRPRA